MRLLEEYIFRGRVETAAIMGHLGVLLKGALGAPMGSSMSSAIRWGLGVLFKFVNYDNIIYG